MELLFTRIISVLCLLIVTLIFGTLPYCIILRSRTNSALSWRERLVRYLNCFSGGVFLGCLFLHLMTEGSEQLDKYFETIEYDPKYPFFNAVVVIGFFLTSSVEYFTHSVLAHRELTSPREVKVVENNGSEESEHLQKSNRKMYGTLTAESSLMAHPDQISKSLHDDTENETSNLIQDTNETNSEYCSAHRHEGSVPTTTAPCERSLNIRSILLLLALSFHSVFDGLALGLQETSSSVWTIFSAVVLHKCIIAFCLGLDIFTSFTDTKVATLMMFIFSLVSPIGASIGITLTSTGINKTAQLLSSGILQGLSCGAFLYVTFLEILSKYWKGGSHLKSFWDILCSLIGFTIMALEKLTDAD